MSLSEIAQAMNFTHAEALRRVSRAIERGELRDLGGDQFEATPGKREQAPTQAPPVQTRIWTVINYRDMKAAWTAAEIARIAEANRDYVTGYLRWLDEQGYVRGQRRPGKAIYFRLTPEAPAIGQPPIWVNQRNRALRRRQKQGEEA